MMRFLPKSRFLNGVLAMLLMSSLQPAYTPVHAALTAPDVPQTPERTQAATWRDGLIQYSDVVNCVSIIQGSPYSEKGVGMFAGQLMDPDAGQPVANQVYYLRIYIAGLGNPCSGNLLNIEFALPANTTLATGANPHYCFYDGGAVGCAAPVAVAAGRYRIAEPLGTYQGLWPLVQGHTYDMRIPVMSSAAISNSPFTAHVRVLDGNSSPDLTPSVGVYVFDSTPAFAFNAPSTYSITHNTATGRGYVYHASTGGNAFVDWSANSSFSPMQTFQFDGDNNSSNGISPLPVGNHYLEVLWDPGDGFVPDTTYYWRMRFVTAPGGVTHTSATQSFRTLADGSVMIGNGSAASCTDAALRSAIDDGTVRNISFDCGLTPMTITLRTTAPRQFTVLSRALSIDGGNKVTLQGVANAPHFIIGPSGALEIKNITLSGGRGAGCGGSIFANGALTATNARFINNIGSNTGGAICAYANVPVLVHESAFIDNTAGPGGFGGGAIWVEHANLTVRASDFSGNTASGSVAHGGAIAISAANVAGRMYIEDSVFTGNSAANGGAIATGNKPASIAASTFSQNSTSGFGGAVFGIAQLSNASVVSNTASGSCDDDGRFLCITVGGGLHGISRVTNTLLSGNGPANCWLDQDQFSGDPLNVTSGGNNLSNDGSCYFSATGDLTNTPAGIGPLAQNNGRTRTHALLAGSAAINAGSNTACAAYGCQDQRGVNAVGTIDIGAFERSAQDAATPTSTPTPLGAPTATPTPTRTPLPGSTATPTPTGTVTSGGGSKRVFLPAASR